MSTPVPSPRPTPQSVARTVADRSPAANWLIPTGLVLLSVVPVVAGSLRLAELAGGPPIVPDGDRVTAAPVALVTHIVAVTVFSLVGAFQFAPGLRRRHRAWHRAAGRVLVLCGLLTAGTGLWLTLFLPPAAVDSELLIAIRVVVSVAMAACVGVGFLAVRRRDFAAHRAWMIRGYAIGMGAGTQFFTQLAWLAVVGPVTASGRTGTMAAGWLINVVVAEWVIRRRAAGQDRRRDAVRVSGSARPRPAG
ncbi:putative membrane protein [Micromonospora sp. Llam0]|uniref:DUF2306 domain-containing protein n=1 Tax=Micromonospora sp. Llam0 TaxID=2485143 RepID=UPI000F4AD460|nr:DUF2306 domain-containing protein [Micromonospora sp. Llam0]ROO59858.1 putative membrane protein [Micromonospora sp. Llam0]